MFVIGGPEMYKGIDEIHSDDIWGDMIAAFEYPSGFHPIYDETDVILHAIMQYGDILQTVGTLPLIIITILPKKWIINIVYPIVGISLTMTVVFLIYMGIKGGNRMPFFVPSHTRTEYADIYSQANLSRILDYEYFRAVSDLRRIIAKSELKGIEITDSSIKKHVVDPFFKERILENVRVLPTNYDSFNNWLNASLLKSMSKEILIDIDDCSEETEKATEAMILEGRKNHPYLTRPLVGLEEQLVGEEEFPEADYMLSPDWTWWWDDIQMDMEIDEIESEFDEEDESHFEQFKDYLLIDSANLQDISFYNITVIGITSIFIMLTIFTMYKLINPYIKIITFPIQYILSLVVDFILGIVKEQTKGLGIQYTPLVYTIFTTVLLYNLLGVLPGHFTVTSQITVTAFIALTLIFGLFFMDLFNSPVIFIKSFIPGNVSNTIKPLIFLIEILSYLLRPISMSVRLFANMLAGHILLHIVIGALAFTWFFLPGIITLPIFVLTCSVFLLEIGISILQSYILVVLFSIYFKEVQLRVLINTNSKCASIDKNMLLRKSIVFLLSLFLFSFFVFDHNMKADEEIILVECAFYINVHQFIPLSLQKPFDIYNSAPFSVHQYFPLCDYERAGNLFYRSIFQLITGDLRPSDRKFLLMEYCYETIFSFASRPEFTIIQYFTGYTNAIFIFGMAFYFGFYLTGVSSTFPSYFYPEYEPVNPALWSTDPFIIIPRYEPQPIYNVTDTLFERLVLECPAIYIITVLIYLFLVINNMSKRSVLIYYQEINKISESRDESGYVAWDKGKSDLFCFCFFLLVLFLFLSNLIILISNIEGVLNIIKFAYFCIKESWWYLYFFAKKHHQIASVFTEIAGWYCLYAMFINNFVWHYYYPNGTDFKTKHRE
jgi:F-type H+-transporting ATPase subunit a